MSASETREYEWAAYYARFNYFSSNKVRPGCYPRVMEHPDPTEKSIVLVHGLTDSPYFMTAIAEFFFGELGYNVYLPLLHCHGLKEPRGMEDVKLDEWKVNVSFAIKTAAAKSQTVSIGGLSTGGTLSLFMAATRPRIGGALYLFSAALGLAGGPFDLLGKIKQILLKSQLAADILDSSKPLIGENPYRYGHMDMDGARELARLIKETDDILDDFNQKTPFPNRVFAAHSEADATAAIANIKDLESRSGPGRFEFYRIPKEREVSHASLVLLDSIPPGAAEPLESANPCFHEMMEAIKKFQS